MNTKTEKSFAQQIADASIAIARANHYLVGFDLVGMAEGISFDDYSDAHRVLVDMELASQAPLKAQLFDRAFSALNDACYKTHKVHLGQ